MNCTDLLVTYCHW